VGQSLGKFATAAGAWSGGADAKDKDREDGDDGEAEAQLTAKVTALLEKLQQYKRQILLVNRGKARSDELVARLKGEVRACVCMCVHVCACCC
jgi:hypothetical protein